MRTASDNRHASRGNRPPRFALWLPCLLLGAIAAPMAGVRAATPATTPSVEAERPQVMDRVQRVFAHVAGSHSDPPNPIWVVAFDQKQGQPPSTRVLMREEFGDPKWRALSRIPARPVGVTSHNAEMVLLMALGDDDSRRAWAWFSPTSDGRGERFTYGPPLPGKAEMIALAGDRRHLWALGRSVGGSASSTTRSASASATTPSRARASTLPATRSAGASAAILHHLNAGEWVAQPAPLPEPVRDDLRGVSMAIVDGRPIVAVASARNTIVRVYAYERNARTWKLLQTLDLKGGPTQVVKVVNVAGTPGVWVWVDTAAGLGEIWTVDDQRVPLAFPGVGLSPGDVDVTVGEQVLVAYRTADGKLLNQRYELKGGTISGAPAELTYTDPHRPEMNWITISVMAVLTALILSTLMRRRAATRDERADPDD